MASRRIALGLLSGAAFVVAAGAAAPPAVAQTSLNDCDVRVGGHRFANGSHVSLPTSRPATIAVTALDEKPRYRVELELAGVRSTVGTGRGSDFGWQRELNVKRYATFGVGTYRLHVRTTVDGAPCVVTGLIDLSGRAPVTTLAGGLATLAALIGVTGLALILFRRGGKPLNTRQGFSVDDPLGEFVAVATPGDYAGWAEVACDQGARTFVTTRPTSETVRAFLAEESTQSRLAEIKSRGIRIRPAGADVALPRVRWRPRPFVIAPIFGILGALGVLLYLQQATVLYPTARAVGLSAAIGLVAGLVITNLSRLLGAATLNRRLAAAESGLEVEAVEPRYPPMDHLDELDTFVWTPTHTVPDGADGVPAWEAPDRTQPPVATLDPALPVRVVERRDGLAQVVCSNGWVGWTDAEPLEEITS
ncbi:MAG TPA: hypothetical protein VFB78_19330 [Acidimicrobiales bacterium]|nr:hypothetical protein [Acidimicrobiales bacterium]